MLKLNQLWDILSVNQIQGAKNNFNNWEEKNIDSKNEPF